MDVINAHVLDIGYNNLYQRADDPFRIKGMGASEESPTPCILHAHILDYHHCTYITTIWEEQIQNFYT